MRMINALLVVSLSASLNFHSAFADEAARATVWSVVQSLGEAFSSSNNQAKDEAYSKYLIEITALRDSGQMTSVRHASLLR